MSRTNASDTRAAIFDAAADLFFDHGYAATSLREVASRVGIQVGSLYNHIDGKHDLLLTIMEGIMDELLDALGSATDAASGPAERLERALDCHIRFHATHSRDVFIGNSELRSLEPEARHRVTQKRRAYEMHLRALVDDIGAAGEADVIDSRLQTYAILAIGTHIASWYRTSKRLTLDEVVDTYTRTIFQQLGYMPAVAPT